MPPGIALRRLARPGLHGPARPTELSAVGSPHSPFRITDGPSLVSAMHAGVYLHSMI